MLTFAIKKKRTPSIAPKRHAPTVSPMSHSMHLQRAKVRHILRGPTLQPKLTIGQPNDRYEQEADRVADQVMRMPEPGVQRQVEPEEEEEEMLQAKPVAEQITPLVQRQVEPKEEEEEILQSKVNTSQTPAGTPDFESRIHTLKGGGQPLPKSVRAFFEPRFGHDFSQVRVHTDSKSSKSASALNARSFTVGQDVVFGPGQYAPETNQGRQLLAHELTHVVQQHSTSEKFQRKVRSNYVSCRNPTPAIAATTGPNPVATIAASDKRAIELLDTIIEELEGARNDILNGEEIAWPTIADVVALELRNRFKMNPDSRRVWTGRGAGTVYVLIKRYKAVRKILDGGWIRYTCLAPAIITTSTCTGPACQGGTRAVSCENFYRIFLCRPWWSDPADEQAMTLLHEGFHIYFGFIGDTGNLGNAHCYEQFVYDLNGLTVPAAYVGMCP